MTLHVSNESGSRGGGRGLDSYMNWI